MKYLWKPDKNPKILNVKVYSPYAQQVMLAVYDSRKRNTVYSKHVTVIKGNDEFEISLPLTPAEAFFEITPVGGMPFGTSSGGLKVDIRTSDFTPGMNCNYNRDPKLQDFLRFISWFSENAGILSTSHADHPDYADYKSVDGRFRIRYRPVIMEDQFVNNGLGKVVPNPRYGQESPTSFRVDADKRDGVTKIEASKKYVTAYTVTGRFALLLHEGSHDFLNADPESEEEADKNAIEIAKCLGFSNREIANAFLEVFGRYYDVFGENASPANVIRKDLILQQLKS